MRDELLKCTRRSLHCLALPFPLCRSQRVSRIAAYTRRLFGSAVKMIIYKDLITGDEMFTDSSKVKLIDGCIYEVECRHVTRKQGDIQIEGFNPSAEEFDEGTDELVESGLDLVLNQRLVETGFSKNDYKNYLKTYTKSLQEKWKALDYNEEQIANAKSKLTEAVKRVLPKLGDYQFFLGESSNPDGCVALLEYRAKEDGSGETPIMIFFKHGLDEEKV